MPSSPALIHIEAIAFDLGRVLVGLDPTWPERLGMQSEPFAKKLGSNPTFHSLERGHLSVDAFVDWMVEQTGHDAESCLAAFCAWVTGPLPGASELLSELQLPVYALSNTNEAHWDGFDPHAELTSKFTALPSHWLGARKPEVEFYERAEAIIGTPKILFLDDRQENVDAARTRGWNAECVVGVKACRSVLSRYTWGIQPS